MSTSIDDIFDVVVVGGGPAGATAAHDLARQGRSVLLLDRAGRIKPCGGAIPPRLIKDFDIPDELLVARARCGAHDLAGRRARSTSRSRAASSAWSTASTSTNGCASARRSAGAVRRTGTLRAHRARRRRRQRGALPRARRRRARRRACGVGARALRHRRRRRALRGGAPGGAGRRAQPVRVRLPRDRARARGRARRGYDGTRCDVYYQGELSPDFYGWVFPHGDTHEHRHRQRRQGLLAAHGTAARCARPAAWTAPRRCAAKARRSR